MTRQPVPPPSPEVQHLPTLLRRVQAGEIRVPAFQREYVWTEKQILELLESIYKGYPIGSLLFWQPTSGGTAIKTDAAFPIPQLSDKKPATYILDGQQRLATIYNCFYHQDYESPDKFNVAFDLRKQSFAHYRPGAGGAATVHLGKLFNPKAFLLVQQQLARETDSESLLDQSVALHAAFQEYMIPIVTIKGRETADIVQIFERINSTGMLLSAVDFMRAVTWSDAFDLTDQAEQLRSDAEIDAFQAPIETIVKLVAISQDLDPIPDSMLQLRGLTASQLQDAVQAAGRALKGAIKFFKEELQILSYEYVPYEAQMLVVARLYMASNYSPPRNAKATIGRWFVRTSIGEELQGKADSVVAQLVRSVAPLVNGEARPFEGRIERVASDLVDRKFIVRRALSSALAVLLAKSQARSVVDGNVIPASDYMQEFAKTHFVPIVGKVEMMAAGLPDMRVFPNMVLVSEDDRRKLGGAAARDVIMQMAGRSEGSVVLSSQAITKEGVGLLAAGSTRRFLEERAGAILRSIEAMIA